MLAVAPVGVNTQVGSNIGPLLHVPRLDATGILQVAGDCVGLWHILGGDAGVSHALWQELRDSGGDCGGA